VSVHRGARVVPQCGLCFGRYDIVYASLSFGYLCEGCRDKVHGAAPAKNYEFQVERSKRRKLRKVRIGPHRNESTTRLLVRIAERDGWTCHLCDLPADLQAPMGPDFVTFDHLRPRVKQGQRTYENGRIAHRFCNTLRGVSSVEQARERYQERMVTRIQKALKERGGS